MKTEQVSPRTDVLAKKWYALTLHQNHVLTREQLSQAYTEAIRLCRHIESLLIKQRQWPNNRVACVSCKEPVDVTSLNAIRCEKCLNQALLEM